jgi:hypothetical protein
MSSKKSQRKSFAPRGRKLGKRVTRFTRQGSPVFTTAWGTEQKSSSPTKSLALSVSAAILGLRNNESRVVSEVKGLGGKVTMSTKVSYPPELIAAFRGMFGSSRVYEFQMHQVLTVSSSAGGGALGFVAISPTVASYGEWTALQALFDEAKAVYSEINWTTILITSGFTNADMVLAFDEQNLTSDPSSYLSVYRLASSKCFVSQLGDAGSGRHFQSHTFATRGWCDTATASPPYSVSPMGGFIGCWVYGNSGLFPTSVAVATISSITVGKFRCRA